MSPEQKHQRKSYKESEDEMLHFQNFGVSFIETRTPGEQFKEHKYDNFPLCLLHSFTEIIIFFEHQGQTEKCNCTDFYLHLDFILIPNQRKLWRMHSL